jgi:uncharacterized protein (TIGR02284 family)
VTGRQDSFAAGSVDAVVSTLNQLIQTCIDGENGFAAAAQAAEEPSLQRLFQSYSQQRAEFAAELELEVRRLAQDPVQSGHPTAALHRSWVDMKAGIAGRGDGQVIRESEREEETAREDYEQALNSPLPNDLRVLVERQLTLVKEAQEQIRSLQQSHRTI